MNYKRNASVSVHNKHMPILKEVSYFCSTVKVSGIFENRFTELD